MTPAQQAALEQLVGRSLVADEISAIDLLLPDRCDIQIAEILSLGRVKPISMPIGIGTILAVLAPSGGEFLNALEAMGATDANVKWALKLIEQSNFDIGMAATRSQMVALKKAAPALAEGLDALLAVAERPGPIHYNAVSDALNIAEGRLTL